MRVAKEPKRKSELEQVMEIHLKENHIHYISEYQFDPSRRWKFDFYLPLYKLAIECEGGTYSNGRHNRGKGFESDCEKYNRALELGYRVLRYTRRMIMSEDAIKQVVGIIREVT